MSDIGHSPDLLLATLRQKMHSIASDLELYKQGYMQCQKSLALERQSRERSDLAVNQLRGELKDALLSLSRCVDELHCAQDEGDQMHGTQIELLQCQLAAAHRKAREADKRSKLYEQRMSEMSNQLGRCEQDLESCNAERKALQVELSATDKSVKCLEYAAERSAHQLTKCQQQVMRLQQRINDTESRAMRAEESLEQFQVAFDRMNKL